MKSYDCVAEDYERIHDEIFNIREQERLRAKLTEASLLLRTGKIPLTALDLGCGSGNLTAHLLELGFHVTAADISDQFLELVERKFSGTGRLKTARLNGKDLSMFESGRFDLTAAYSVLHHVPDYLGITRELVRVTGMGGILYLDHELSPDYWLQKPQYTAFLNDVRSKPPAVREFARFFRFSTYVNKVRQMINPRYISEGDIHVWPDDHIDWPEIEKILAEAGFKVHMREDYLLFRGGYSPSVYAKYEKLCNDVRLLVAGKERYI